MTVNSYRGVANMFNLFFRSICVADDSKDMPPHIIPNLSVDFLSFINIYECDLLAALKTTDITKACRANIIPGRILCDCAQQVAFPITILFNKSLKTGIFSSSQKKLIL